MQVRQPGEDLIHPDERAGGIGQVIAPAALVLQRHQLDEAHVPWMAQRQRGHVLQLIVVQPAGGDHVDLDRLQPAVLGCLNALPDPLDRPAAGDSRVALRPQRVQADVDPPQTGGSQPGRLTGEQRAVGGQGDVLNPRDGGQHLHQALQALSDERLASGQPHLADSMRGSRPHHRGNFLIGQDGGMRLPCDAFRRHTVHAAQIAAVSDGYAQILDLAPP